MHFTLLVALTTPDELHAVDLQTPSVMLIIVEDAFSSLSAPMVSG